MFLHIIVQHPSNFHPKWRGNTWEDHDRILSITTTPKVAEQCRNANIVYVHRSGWKPQGEAFIRPSIACSAKVAFIGGSSENPLVTFTDVQPIGLPAKRQLNGPTSSYFAAAP